jgi:lipopolysaccharide/colanic/teichoic acid biosynthesis glycosyltransferase
MSKRPSNLRRYAGDGTAAMITGTLVAGIGNYAYQLIGGRALGPHLFAPIGSLLTIHFLAFIVVLLPVEQLVIRSVTIHGGLTRATVTTARVTVVLTAVLAFAVGYMGRNQFFGGDVRFAYLAAATVLTHALFVHGRGSLAGLRRFRAYGEAGGGAAVLRLAVSIAVLVAAAGSAVGFAAALAVGPLMILAWPSSLRITSIDGQRTDPGRFLVTFVLAAATSQVLLLTGPLVAGVLGATAAGISTIFVTFTLARAPLTFGYNLIARALPPFTALAQRGEDALLTRWVGRLLIVGLAGAVPAALLGFWVGPAVVEALFGAGFRPDPTFAMLAAAGVSLAGASLFLGQILVARGETGKLAIAWAFGIAGALAGLVSVHGDPSLRIGVAFLAGELAAILALAAASVRAPSLYPMAKRTLDVALGSVLTVVLAPAFALAAAAVKLDSRGPVLFRQRRIGLEGVPFDMLKFRTMHHGADEAVHLTHLEHLRERPDDPRLKVAEDPRITRIGRFLRKGSLDELPNLWNVVRGDMSLVGPRPLVPVESEALGDPVRLTVKPGITGLAQIHGRDSISPDQRNLHDAEYVRTRSFLLDLRILGATVPAIFRNPGE